MRKIIISAFTVVVAIVVALSLLPFLIDVNDFRTTLEGEAQKHLGRPVKLGQMRLKLLPIAFRVDNASVGEDPRFGQGQFAQVKDLRINLKLWPLLHRKLEIVSLDLRGPQIELIRNAEGVWNFSSIGHIDKAPPAPPSTREPQSHSPSRSNSSQPAPETVISLDYMGIVDGKVALTDQQKHQSRAVYDHIDLKLSHFVPGQPFTLSASLHFSAEGEQQVTLKGRVGPVQAQNIPETPVDLNFDLNGVRLSGVKKFLNSNVLEGTDFVIAGNMNVRSGNESLTSDGQVTLREFRIKGTDVAPKVTADYKVSANLKGDLVTIDKGDLQVGASRVSVTGTVNTSTTPSKIDVQLRASKASVAECARLASRFGLHLGPGIHVDGDLSGNVRFQYGSEKPTIEGQLNTQNVEINGDGVPQPIRAREVNLSITPEGIRSDQFTASVGKTEVVGQVILTGYATANPSISARVKAAHADIARLLEIAKKYRTDVVKDVVASGSVSFDLNANGPLKNISALTFSGSSEIHDAMVKAPSLAQPVRVSNARIVMTPQAIESNDFATTVGDLACSVQFAMAAYNSPNPQVKIALRSTRADIAELLNTARIFGVSDLHGLNGSGSVTFDVRASGPWNDKSALAFSGSSEIQDATLNIPSLGKPVHLTAAKFAFTPQTIQSNQFSASTRGLAVTAQFALAGYSTPDPRMNVTVTSSHADITELLDLAHNYKVDNLQGVTGSGVTAINIRANGHLNNISALTFSGDGHLSEATLSTPYLTKPIIVESADFKLTNDSIVLDKLSTRIDQTRANGMLSIRNPAAPVVQFALNLDKVSIAELQQLTSPAGPVKASSGPGANWSVISRAYAQGNPAVSGSILQKTTGTGTVTIGAIAYDELVLNNVRASVMLDRGLIKLAPITAQMYGGQQNGAINVDTRQTPTAVSLTTTVQRVDANRFLSSTSSLNDVLYGQLSSNGSLTFQLASAHDIARTLNGKFSLSLANGKLAHVDFLNQLAAVGRFVQPGGGDGGAQQSTNLLKLAGNFEVTNGSAQTNDLQGVMDGGTLAAQGAVNLVDQELNMHVTAILSKVMSEKVGGTTIGGYMNTALENTNGELVVPVIVTGTFRKPQVAPDLKKVAEMKLQKLVPTGSSPAQATAGILGQVLDKKNQQGPVGGTVGQILGTLGGQQQTSKPNRAGGNQPVASPQPEQQSEQSPDSQQQQQKQQQQPQTKKKKSALDVIGDILKKQQEEEKKQPSPPPK